MLESSIAVVGATGAVGQVFLSLLEKRNFSSDHIRVFASDNSVGKELMYRGERLVLEKITRECFQGIDVAFVSVDADVSKRIAPDIIASGAIMIDDSSAFRMDKDVPLVVPEVNADDLIGHKGIISIPNCSTTPLVMALYPIHKVNPIKRIIVDTYQSVSGTGRAAVKELRDQADSISEGNVGQICDVYPFQIAFNLIPQIDQFMENSYTKEEWKLVQETRKILHSPDLLISATCVRVPVFISHSEAIHVELTHSMDPSEACEILESFEGVKVFSISSSHPYPMPLDAVGEDDVLIGRLRKDVSSDSGLAMWVVSDNLMKGAALNALQIYDELVQKELIV